MSAHGLCNVVIDLFADEYRDVSSFPIVLVRVQEGFEGELKCQGVVEEGLQAMMDGVFSKSDDDIINFLMEGGNHR